MIAYLELKAPYRIINDSTDANKLFHDLFYAGDLIRAQLKKTLIIINTSIEYSELATSHLESILQHVNKLQLKIMFICSSKNQLNIRIQLLLDTEIKLTQKVTI